MALTASEFEYNSVWGRRIEAARKHKDAWANRFSVPKLVDYYEGKQWKLGSTFDGTSPYVLNLVYSTIKIKLANILFKRPQFIVAPVATSVDWDIDAAALGATLKQDVLNTIVQNPELNFTTESRLAALDSFFSFGVIEVAYAADWRNPNKIEPLTSSHLETEVDEIHEDGEASKLLDENELPHSERIYFKRINPKRFYVSSHNNADIKRCRWYGYWEYISVQELQHSENIELPELLNRSLKDEENSDPDNSKFVKCWHIWDFVSKKRLLLLDDSFEELWSEPFERAPHSFIRWDFRTEGFYPVPPVFQWLSSQNEINEAAEGMRNYRKRFARRYQIIEGTIDDNEIEKFESGLDWSAIKVKRENAITPIHNPDIGPAIQDAFLRAKSDFNIVTGTSSEQRGQSDRTTATQARIIDAASNVRESAEQMDFSEFLIAIARETLKQVQERLSLPLIVKSSQNPQEQSLGEVKETPFYQAVQISQLDDGYDFEIAVDVINASPLAAQAEKAKFIEFLSIVNQFPQIALSPVLIREAAYRTGYRNERVIKEMQQAALLNMLGQAQDAQGNTGEGNNFAKEQIAQNNPNTADQVKAQMDQMNSGGAN